MDAARARVVVARAFVIARSSCRLRPWSARRSREECGAPRDAEAIRNAIRGGDRFQHVQVRRSEGREDLRLSRWMDSGSLIHGRARERGRQPAALVPRRRHPGPEHVPRRGETPRDPRTMPMPRSSLRRRSSWSPVRSCPPRSRLHHRASRGLSPQVPPLARPPVSQLLRPLALAQHGSRGAARAGPGRSRCSACGATCTRQPIRWSGPGCTARRRRRCAAHPADRAHRASCPPLRRRPLRRPSLPPERRRALQGAAVDGHLEEKPRETSGTGVGDKARRRVRRGVVVDRPPHLRDPRLLPVCAPSSSTTSRSGAATPPGSEIFPNPATKDFSDIQGIRRQRRRSAATTRPRSSPATTTPTPARTCGSGSTPSCTSRTTSA